MDRQTEQQHAAKLWLIEYDHAGAQWSLDLFACDERDAQQKLRAIGTTGRVSGEVVHRTQFHVRSALAMLLVGLISGVLLARAVFG